MPYLLTGGDGVVRGELSGETVDEILRAGGQIWADNGSYSYDNGEYVYQNFGHCGAYAPLSANCLRWLAPPFERRFPDLLSLALYAAFDTEEYS